MYPPAYVMLGLSPLTYALYLIINNALIIDTCFSNNIRMNQPEAIMYFIGLVFEIILGIVMVGIFYIKKNTNALMSCLIVNIGVITLRTLICTLIYYNSCNIIYIMIGFSILTDFSSIILYASAIVLYIKDSSITINNDDQEI